MRREVGLVEAVTQPPASELLRALDERYRLRATGTTDYIGKAAAAFEIADALPALVELVEAAERVINNNAYPEELAAALANLREALGG